MRDRPVIALIAGRVSLDSCGNEEQHGLWAAIAVLRALLERGGRALLGAESTYVVPLLMAAGEYLEPRRVETSEEASPPPVILGPLMEVDSVEDSILRDRTQREDVSHDHTLLEDLAEGGLFEQGRVRNDNARGPRELFGALLSESQPQAIIAVGDSTRTAPLLEAAEAYHPSEFFPPPRLLWVLPGGKGFFGSRWEQVGSESPDEHFPPPMLNGEIVDFRSEGRSWDEGLVVLARRAAEEASLALAIDRAVEAILEDSLPSRRAR